MNNDYCGVTDLSKKNMRYRVCNDGTNSKSSIESIWEWCIPGKNGHIYPVGYNGDIGVYSESSRVIKKLKAMGLKAVQGTVAYRCNASLLDQVAAIIGAYRR